MFESMNPLDRSTAWLEIFILMFVAFLIGYLFARWYYKRKMDSQLQDSFKENRTLKAEKSALKREKENTSGFETIDTPGKIKAVKTRERAGVAVEKKVVEKEIVEQQNNKPELNFNSFGKANAAERDDLKKITGVGPFIEKKLNSLGIYTFEQISRFSKDDIKTVTSLIEFFPGRIERDNWKGQAQTLHKTKTS